ncbi:MAG: tail fiber protein [Bacteroidota bacterium]
MEPLIGQIVMFAGNFAPRGWALCDGQLLAISENSALFSILGTTYGGDGRTTFGLPDLRGRVPMHAGNGPGRTPRSLGSTGGSETNTLTVNQLPAHNHSAKAKVQTQASTDTGNQHSPEGNYPATNEKGLFTDAPNTSMGEAKAEVAIGNTGANQAINNVQPFQCVNYIIALQGVYPSRS